MEGRKDMVFSRSIGIDFAPPGSNLSYSEMFSGADEALYQVKKHEKAAARLYGNS